MELPQGDVHTLNSEPYVELHSIVGQTQMEIAVGV